MILDRDVAVLNPLVFPAVKLQVYQVDVELAEQILSRPAPEGAEGEYVEEEWRCPKCHRRKVELVPASRARRLARMVCMMVWLLPFIGALITWLAVPSNYNEQVQEAVGWAVCPWAIVVLVLTTGLVVRRRLKRCAYCGHQW